MALAKLTKRGKTQQSFLIKDAIQVFIGDYAAIDSTGYLVPVADTVNYKTLGHVVAFDSPKHESAGGATGDTSATTGIPAATVDIDGGIVSGVSVATVASIADVGKKVYATGAQSFTLVATANIPAVGMIVKYLSGTNCDVLFFPAEEMNS